MPERPGAIERRLVDRSPWPGLSKPLSPIGGFRHCHGGAVQAKRYPPRTLLAVATLSTLGVRGDGPPAMIATFEALLRRPDRPIRNPAMNVSIEDRVLPTEHGDVFTRRWRTGNRHKTPIVLLHDSLGCVELWRDFPERLAATTSRNVIAYDRLGFGRSAAHPGGWTNHFVRDETDRFFPPVWQALDFEHFIAFGHSAGGIMATRLASCNPRHCRALITESAQAFVEDRTLQGIREARTTFTQPEQLARLRKYHGDKVRWILRAWFDTWLSDSYAAWTLADSASGFTCPLLTIHGLQDEYGSVAHPRRIAALGSGPTRELLLDHCRHVPHREHPEAVLVAVERFLDAMDV